MVLSMLYVLFVLLLEGRRRAECKLNYNMGRLHAGAPEVAFGAAVLTQGREEGGYITCKVPERVAVREVNCEGPSEVAVDAACVCCELVDRLAGGRAADSDLQEILGGILKAISGKAQVPELVEQLFRDRFKSAGGGQCLLGGASQGGATAGNERDEGVSGQIRHAEEVDPPQLGRTTQQSREPGELSSEIPESNTTMTPGQIGKV